MAPLHQPAAWSGPLPEATPPSGMSLFQLPTGTYETRAALAVTGGSWRDRRQLAATSVLVTHPQGDFLIDAGFGSRVRDHVAALPRMERAPLHPARTVSEQLDAAGYDRARLRGVLLTHAHWDHVSGLPDLHVPVWMDVEEQRYAAGHRGGTVFRDVSRDLEIHPYAAQGPDHLGFSPSLDVHGDGSLVVARAGGHTDGSVVVFVALPTGERYAFIGDLTWQLDGIRRRAERPLLMRRLADVDPRLVRENLLRAIALQDVVHLVPAHDRDAYAGIPTLPAPAPATH